jgi:hypothetical protein
MPSDRQQTSNEWSEMVKERKERKAGPWYEANMGNDRQGLVIEEATGRNIAVTYDKADAALVAAAPELLDTLKEAVDVLAHMQHFYHGSQLSYQDMAQTLERWNATIQKATSSAR